MFPAFLSVKDASGTSVRTGMGGGRILDSLAL